MSHLSTIGDLLSTQARLQPLRIGARDLERSLTFAQWNARACRLANGLSSLGLRKGDRVAVLAYNRLEWAEIYIACAKAGFVAVPLNFRLTGPEMRYIVQDCAAKALIAEQALAHLLELERAALAIEADRFVLIGQGDGPPPDGWTAYEGLIAAASEEEPRAGVTPDDAWCLMYTSGTTGKPKGAIRDHRGMFMLALMTQVELSLARGDDALLVMPMCHANSLNFFTSFLSIGATVTVFSRASFDPQLCLHVFGESGVTFTSLVPTHYVMMLEIWGKDANRSDFGSLRKLMISSAPARAETKRQIMEMFPNAGLFELYGSTEAGWVTMLHPDEQFDHLGTVGREVVGSAPILLIGEDGLEVPDGQPGELYSCSPYCFTGYWNLPEKTAEAFRGAYITVGDVAVRDTEGFIRLIDRKKNMIISGGENLYASEVEAALAKHPGIRDVAVVGLPDPKWGELVAAMIVPRQKGAIGEDEILEWARGELAGYKRPRRIRLVDELPRNATGKIMHHVVKQHFDSAETD